MGLGFRGGFVEVKGGGWEVGGCIILFEKDWEKGERYGKVEGGRWRKNRGGI